MSCKQCAKCCYKFGITLTLDDMNREPRLWDYAVPIQKVENQKTRRFMAEKQHPFALHKNKRGSSCVFLLNDMCRIYSTRPQICRDYQCHRSEQ